MCHARLAPGPICALLLVGSCSCGYRYVFDAVADARLCGYVFDAVADAYTRWPDGRLCCYACA